MSYADQCEECGQSFKYRHYVWFVCVTCQKGGDLIDKEEHDRRILSNEELE